VEKERVQRRLAAILAADVAGYSRLTGADEEGTIARLRALRGEVIDPAIAAHQGRIVKVMGDGFLAEFPSVVDALRCAVSLQRTFAERNATLAASERLNFRMGVNLGDVVVEGDDILGDGVNIAARLEAMAEPGAICLSRAAYEQGRGKVEAGFADLGERTLKNIAEPVHVYAVAAPGPAPGRASAPAAENRLAGAPRQSLVILPFANLGDPAQDYFVDGITDTLTTEVSRLPGSFVIARNSAFAYRGKALDAKQIGRELGVRYVMEGSVQTGASRIRINAQLIDAATGAHLWAERFDKPRGDLFDMQDEITTRLARSLELEIHEAESRRLERERPDNMDSIDLTMRGMSIWNKPTTPNRAEEARQQFEAALRLDPRNVYALIGLAGTHMTDVMSFVAKDRPEQIRIAEEAIVKALSLAPDNPFAHHCYAEVLYARHEPEAALHELEIAISLNPNSVWAHAQAGLVKIVLGRAEETETDVGTAMRLSPREPGIAVWHLFIGLADLALGRLDKAIAELRKSTALNPNMGITHVMLAAAFALAGRQAEAEMECAAGRRLLPDLTIARFKRELPGASPIFAAQRERIGEGLRLAGVTEDLAPL
jgi:class 3 adenylate cyclase/TolB-like protein/Flp pilus assembly protein TadD